MLFLSPVSVRADTVADSFADWSTTGTQGEKGWYYGYYNYTLDGDKEYATEDFIPFKNEAGPGGGAVTPDGNNWTGSAWDLEPSGGPWTFLAQEGTHPNGTNSPPNHEHWTIRRWVCDRDMPDAEITWHLRKTNLNGSGVGGKLFVNGEEIDSARIAGDDSAGVTRTVQVALSEGDIIDLAHTPVGPGGDRADGSDGSANRLTIDDGHHDMDDDGVPDEDDNCPQTANAGQEDADHDGVGDVCDNCPDTANPDQRDRDRDGIGDACEVTCEGATRLFDGAHVEDDTTEGGASVPTSDVILMVDDGSGMFDHSGGVYTLDGNGDCTAVYTPGPLFDDGTNDYTNPIKTITATYAGSSVYTGKSALQQLTVELRPTETTVRCVDEDDNEDAMLVNETGTCTVTVKDASGIPIPSGWPDGPVGNVKITSSLETGGRGNIFPAEITYPAVAPSGGESEISFDYGCTSLDRDADYDTIGGIYTAVGGIYEDSAGGYAQAIYRRPTETSITLTATDDGYDAEVTVVEQSGLAGAATAPFGDILVKTDDDGDGVLEETTKCSANFYNVIPCSFSGSTDAIIVNVGVFYEPDDGVHLKSAGSDYVTREDAPNLPSGGGAGSMPPDGAINIDAITLGLNSGVLAANTLALIFDAAALVADATPDPVVGVGVGIIVVAVTGEKFLIK